MRIVKNKYGTFIEPDFRIIDKTDFNGNTKQLRDTESLSFVIPYCCILGALTGFLYSYFLGW